MSTTDSSIAGPVISNAIAPAVALATSNTTVPAAPNSNAANTAPDWGAHDQSVPATRMDFFTTLPVEMQREIMKAAIKGRLVIWGSSGGGNAPSYRHINQALRQYTMNVNPLAPVSRRCKAIRSGKYWLFVNFQKDVIYRKALLPTIMIVRPPGGLGPPAPTTAHPPGRLHLQRIEVAATPLPGFRWLEPCLRFAINIDDLAARGIAWNKLARVLPNLQELIVILWPKLTRATVLEELFVVTAGTPPQTAMMNDVLADFQWHQINSRVAWPVLPNLKVTFMKTA